MISKRILLLIVLLLSISSVNESQELSQFPTITPSNIENLEIVRTVSTPNGSIYEISEDGQWIITARRMRDANQINIINTASSETPILIDVESNRLMIDERISPNSRYFVARDRTSIWVWDITNGNLLNQFPDSDSEYRENYSFTSDGRYMIFASQQNDDHNLMIYDYDINEIITQIEQTDIVRTLVSPNEYSITTISESPSGEFEVYIWKEEIGSGIYERKLIFETTEANAYVEDMAYTSDGIYALIMVASYDSFDRTIIVWNTISNRQEQTIEFRDNVFFANSYTDVLATRRFNAERTFIFVNLFTMQFYEELIGVYNILDTHPDEEIIVSLVENGIAFWNVVNGEQLLFLENVSNPQFSKNGDYLVTVDIENRKFDIWAVVSDE